MSVVPSADHRVLGAGPCRRCRGSSFDLERGRYGVLLRCRSCGLTALLRVGCSAGRATGRAVRGCVVRSGDVVCSGCGNPLPVPAPVGV